MFLLDFNNQLFKLSYHLSYLDKTLFHWGLWEDIIFVICKKKITEKKTNRLSIHIKLTVFYQIIV